MQAKNHSTLLRPVSLLAPLLLVPTAARADVGAIYSETKLAHLAPIPLMDQDEFGRSLARIGDLNGDGVRDLVVGAPGDHTTGLGNGAIHILFMASDGDVSSVTTILGGTTGQSFLGFGRAVCNLGDVDDDGTSDIAVGMEDAVDVMLMLPTGQPHTVVRIEDGAAGFSGSFNDAFGAAVSRVGDFDGDGVEDLMVGAPQDDDGGTFTGAVYLLSLRRTGTVKSQVKISALSGNFTGALDAFDGFGSSVTRIGDLDGDGLQDFAVGATGDDDGASAAGAVWILRMAADGTVSTTTKISATAGGFSGTLELGDVFGQALSRLGDVNGDGVLDIAVGAFGDDDGGSNRGALWTLLLNADGTVADAAKLGSTTGGLVGPLDDGDLFGAAVAWLGDLDGDGGDEIAIGSPRDDDGGPDRGAVYLVSRLPYLQAEVTPLGCGRNPAGSLAVKGNPVVGTTMGFAIHNPFGSQRFGSLPVLVISPVYATTPCGIPMSGWNMDPTQASGELLVLPPFAAELIGKPWIGAPVTIQVPIGLDPALVGLRLGAQGAILDFSGTPGTVRFGLTEGVETLLGSCP